MLERVRGVPGVAKAAGGIFTTATFLDVHRKRLTSGGAPAFVASRVPQPFESFKPIEGRFPRGPGEVAIDQATSERSDLKVGGAMLIAGRAPAKRYAIVGIVKFGGGESFGGAGAAMLVPAEAQRVVDEPGRFDQIDVAAAPGVTPKQLRASIRAVLPRTVDVRTGTQQAAKNTSDLEENLGFLRTFLLVFAYVSLVVGAFIIFNTFSITVAQRTREFGLLRTLGASRGQIMREVVAEGLLLGVIGAVLGLFAGIGLAPALDQLFKAFGADLPDSGTVLETRTIVVSLLVGIVVTVLAGLQPALRATRVTPLAAMREGVEIPASDHHGRRASDPCRGVRGDRGSRRRAALERAVRDRVRRARDLRHVPARQADPRRGSPSHYRVVPALAKAIGVLVAWRGITGRLAKENSMRQPGRTMVTAAALTVGIALVAFVAVFADGLKATIDHTISRSFAGNLIVENSQGGGEEQGIPAALGPAVESVPGVDRVTPIAFTVGRMRGTSSNATITAIDASSFGSVYRIEWQKGSNATLAGLRGGGTIASKKYAKAHHLRLGQTISVLTPANQHVPLKLIGTVDEEFGILQDLTIGLPLARSAFGLREDAFDFVAYDPGADNARVQPAIDRLLASQFPQARSRTAKQFKEEQAKQVNTLLALIYVLLALSVIVSLFGIVNTLILSIYERTRELGMMRAIGTSRRQLRQMIRYESVITSLIGGVLGLVIGVIGAVLVAALLLSGSGYIIAIPVGTLVVLLVVAAIAGVIAAQLPARRAARLDFLKAVTSE